MFRPDYLTALAQTALLSATFTLALLGLWTSLRAESAYRWLLLWNGLLCAAFVLRLLAGELPSLGGFLIYWTIYLIAWGFYCAAMLAVSGYKVKTRVLVLCTFVILALIWALALLAPTRYPMVVAVAGYNALMFGALIVVALMARALRPNVRLAISMPFILGFAVSALATINYVRTWREGAVVLPSNSLVYFGLSIIVISCNLVVLLVFLQSQRKSAQASQVDALTGALNRRGFAQMINLFRERGSLSRSGAIVMIDFDHFKVVNDTHGHQTGDMALRLLSDLVSGAKRPDDLFARLGGEEYCLLLPGVSAQQASTVAERLRKMIASQAITSKHGKVFNVSASFGVAETPPLLDDWETAFQEAVARADIALFHAKSNGRNQVVVYSDVIKPPRNTLSLDSRMGHSRPRAVFQSTVIDPT